MKTPIIILIAGIVIAGFVYLGTAGKGEEPASVENVSIVDGVQIIEITARGGYQPKRTLAQAGMPTVLRFKTNGTYDCSIALRVPDINVNAFLPQTGNTDFDAGTPSVGVLNGLCSMGMYRFSVDFR